MNNAEEMNSQFHNNEMECFSIEKNILKKSIKDALTYAFLSLPFTNANIKSGSPGTGLKISNRVENILKGKIAESIILEMFKKDSLFIQRHNLSHYIASCPKKTPFWECDRVDAVKMNINNQIVSEIDIKTMNINWKEQNPPSLEQLSQFIIKRSTRAPSNEPEIHYPFGILLEEPWRHYHKLLQQTENKKTTKKLDLPFEVLFGLCPKLSLEKKQFSELTELYIEYYSNWQQNKSSNLKQGRIEFPGRLKITTIPIPLKNLIQTPRTYPACLEWIIENWNRIEPIIQSTSILIEELMQDYWIWIFGVADQNSAIHFIKIYQNDGLYFNRRKLWSSATRSPIEKKWSKQSKLFKKEQNACEKVLHPPDDLYLNNHAIDVSSHYVRAMIEYLR